MDKWTDREVETLVKMWGQKKSSGEISKATGRSRSAVMGKIFRLDLNRSLGTPRTKLTINGITRGLVQWARLVNMHPATLKNRLECGWDEVEAVYTPVRKKSKPASGLPPSQAKSKVESETQREKETV